METALLLPVFLVMLLLVVQVGLLMRDRVVVVHAARAAARAVVVEPTPAAARAALRHLGGNAAEAKIDLNGELRSGGHATVTVTMRPTAVPMVGRLVSGVRLSERLGVYVEGPE